MDLEGLGRGLSVVGLGRSADASAYFLPELGLVLDAGIHVKSLQPKCVLLTHGHRDHTAALPAMASRSRRIFAPKASAAGWDPNRVGSEQGGI